MRSHYCNRVVMVVALGCAFVWSDAQNGGQANEKNNLPASGAAMLAKPVLTVEAKALDAHRVQLTIDTNLPMPIEVGTSISLQGQKPNDAWIGYDDRAKLNGARTIVVLDTSKSKRPLPAGTYVATVDFYPQKGAAGNSFRKDAPPLHAEKPFKLIGSGGSAADAARLGERQRWAMANVIQDMPWNQSLLERRLGKSQKGRSTISHLHDAYYFPGADMTIHVNRLTDKVTTMDRGNKVARPNATRSDYERRGLKWPLAVDAGYLGCDGRAVWFATPEGVTYAVNGAAQGRYRPIESIWLPNKQLMGGGKTHDGPTIRIDISDLLNQGLQLCS